MTAFRQTPRETYLESHCIQSWSSPSKPKNLQFSSWRYISCFHEPKQYFSLTSQLISDFLLSQVNILCIKMKIFSACVQDCNPNNLKAVVPFQRSSQGLKVKGSRLGGPRTASSSGIRTAAWTINRGLI